MAKTPARSTHEDLMRYVMGEDYHEELVGPDVGERPVVRHVRGGKTPLMVILMALGSFLMVLALTFVAYPRSLFYVGLVPTPAPIPVQSRNGAPGTTSFSSGSITLQVGDKSVPEWSGGDFRHGLRYTSTNLGSLYVYPTVLLVLLDRKGRPVESLVFTTGKGVLAPGEVAKGVFYWPRDAGDGRAVAFRVTFQTGEGTGTNALESSGTVTPTGTVSPGGEATPAVPPAGPGPSRRPDRSVAPSSTEGMTGSLPTTDPGAYAPASPTGGPGVLGP